MGSVRKSLLGSTAALGLLLPWDSTARADQVIADDLIVQGSTCIGFDCVDGEDFGFSTLKLKENNLRILFDDTSVSGGFAATDWQLTANDNASGGRSFFAIDNVTNNTRPFMVLDGAGNNALVVGSNSKVGIGTDAPLLDLHIQNGNTPAIRLEQTNAGGFTAQTWDIGANEANFFVRDLTSGSQLPFRIRPGAPTSSLDIAASGNVGLGTASPLSKLHVSGLSTADTFGTFGPGQSGTGGTGTAGAPGLTIGYAGSARGDGGSLVNAYSSTGTAGNLSIATDGTTRMFIDGAGNVGIGTTAPTAQLSTTGSVQFAGLAGCSSGLATNAAGDLQCGVTGSGPFASNNTANAAVPDASGTDATAGGYGARATTANSTAVGNNATATGALGGASAYGYGASAAGSYATALGAGAQANAAGSVALGQGSLAEEANTVSVGQVGAERRVVNVAAGTATTDAVNVGQLAAVGTGTASGFGGGASYNAATGVFTGPTYTFGSGAQFNNVGDALGNLDTRTTSNTAAINTLSNNVTNGTTGPVQRTGNANELALVAPGGTGAAPGVPQTLANVAAGTVSAASTQAVNGSQLFATNQRTAAAFGGGAGIDADGLFTAPSYAVQGGTYNNVGGALGALDQQTSANTTAIAGNAQAIGILQGQTAANTANIATNTQNIALLQTGQSGAFRSNNTSGYAAPQASGADAVAGGFGSVASGGSTVAIGTGARATQFGATAVGAGAVASGDPTTAMGFNAQATGAEASAYGAFAVASGDNSTALGRSATAAGTNSVAVGVGATASQANTVAIGTGAATTRANQVAIGTAGQTYTLAGLTSAQSLAAQSGGTGFVTTDANGNLAATGISPNGIAALDGRVATLEAGVSSLNRYAIESRKEARRGIASAMALASAPLPSAPGRLTYVLNGATFRNEYAVGGSVAYRLDTNLPIALTAGVAGGGNVVGARIGIMGEL